MIRITEQQLYDLISESIHRVLSEAKTTADEVYQKYYSDLDRKLFDAVLKADPTTKNGYTGKYAKWLLNLARHGKWKAGDAPETRYALERFMRMYKNLEKKDIQQYESVGELYNAVRQSEPQKTRKETKAEANKLYEDSDWTVIVPKTEEAAKLYGKGTKWCTAADKNNMFEHYTEEGPLYILISKKDGSKFQLHFPSNQYMDTQDDPIDMGDIAEHGNVENLTKFLKAQTKGANVPLFYLFPDERTLENLDNYMYNLADAGKDIDYDVDVTEIVDLFSPKFSITDIYNVFLRYYRAYHFFNEGFKINEDLEVVYNHDFGYNLLQNTSEDTEEVLSQQWFTRIDEPTDNTGIMRVHVGLDFNYLTPDGQLLLKANARFGDNFSDGIAIYYPDIDYVPSFLFANGHTVDTSLKGCSVEDFRYNHPYTLVSTLDGDRGNLIGKDGKCLFDRWLTLSDKQGNPHGWYVYTTQGDEYFMDARNGKMYDAEQAEPQNNKQ